MKSIEINLQLHRSFLFYEKFFEVKNVSSHLFFLEEWLELMVTGNQADQKYTPSDLLFFYQFLTELYEVSFALKEENSSAKNLISLRTTLEEGLLSYDTYCRTYKTRYLTDEELMQPLLVLNFMHSQTVLAQHKSLLFDWLSRSLEESMNEFSEDLIYPLYRNTKRLIEASWLIYERLSGTEAYPLPNQEINHFQDTCPNLLENENLNNPYLIVIAFFNHSSLNSHRNQAREWYRAALAGHLKSENTPNFSYFHDQLIQLLEACYRITAYQIPYLAMLHRADYSNQWMALQKKINALSEERTPYETLNLNGNEIANPQATLRRLLTLENIKKMRQGLKQWNYCGTPESHNHLSITPAGAFELYENLIKIMELAFLTLIGEESKPLPQASDETLISN